MAIMRQQLQPGQQVTVIAFRGRQPTVTVVEDRGDVVLICKPEEYSAAKAGNRIPASVGFHREDVIDPATTKKDMSSESAVEHRGSKAGD